MFKTIKEQTDLVEVISFFTDEDTKTIGENVTLESDTCPFCGHKECFRIKPDGIDSFYKCFSCDKAGDAIKFVEDLKELTPVEACKLIAKEFKVVLPVGSPIQEIFTLASRYYKNCLIDSCNKEYPELNGLTPQQYQIQVRGHKLETIEKLCIGWSDGGLMDYLRGVGVDDALLLESGLMNKANKDFLPAKVFIYPHLVNGKVSHFTFKDPLKKLTYQLKNSSKLNGHSWYNQDSVKDSNTTILVEGENDLASIVDAGWDNVIASIGNLGGTQIEWLIANCASKHVVTLFDNDDAGGKYRDKVSKIKGHFASLRQITPGTAGQDIDDLLRSGKQLSDIVASVNVENQDAKDKVLSALEGEEPQDTAEEKLSDGSITVMKGCYYRMKLDKEGGFKPIKISNFTISLRNVFIHDCNRAREVVFRRDDNKVSRPVNVSSEIKTSLKSFKTFVANSIDGSFYGSEADLTAMWEFIYLQGGENEVNLIEYVGRNPYGWMFHNCMITHTGVKLEPDTSGTFWKEGHGNGNSTGIRAISINANKSFDDSNLEIPLLETGLSPEESKQFFSEFIRNFKLNLDDIGLAIMMLAWARAVAYSDWFIKTYGHFPGMYLCGGPGRGKTTITKWILALYNMQKCGHIMISSIRSPVAMERKVAYYSSLPICIDELRNDAQTNSFAGTFRNWYDRNGRDIGTNLDSTSIKSLPIRACVFFSGQDNIKDQATKQRSIQIRIPKIQNSNRDTVTTYDWMSKNDGLMSSIGYGWILETQTRNLPELKKSIDEFAGVLRRAGLSSPRFEINYALLAVMGRDICSEYFPDFDWAGYVVNAAVNSSHEDVEDNLINRFFDCAETLTIGDNPKINPDNFKVEGNNLIIWFNSFFTEVSKELKHQGNLESDFSRGSLIDALVEQDWFISKDIKKRVGLDNKLRHVLMIDLDKAPEKIRLFAAYIKREQENG